MLELLASSIGNLTHSQNPKETQENWQKEATYRTESEIEEGQSNF